MRAVVVVMGGAEVNDLDRALLVDVNQQVLRLEVSVSNIPTVTVSDSLENLFRHMSGLLLSELLARADLFKELASIAKLSHEEDVAFVLVDFIEANDVWVIQVLEDVDFILHSDTLSIIELQLVNNFDCALLSVRLQSRFLYLAEGTLSEDIVVQFILGHEDFHILILSLIHI